MEGAMFTKQRVAVLVAEFLGTAVWALAVLAVATSQIGLGYFVSFTAGLVVLLLVVIFGGITGGYFNPAVTLGLWTIRKLTALRAVGLIAAQLLGGLAAFTLFQYLRGGDYSWGNNAGGYEGTVLVAEVIGTAIFAFGIAAAIYQPLTGGMKAAIVGVALTVGVMTASISSLGLLNPAVAFAAERWELSTYVLGPVLGAIIGLNLYNLVYSSATAPVARRTTRATTVTAVKATPIGTKSTATATKKPVAKKKVTPKKK